MSDNKPRIGFVGLGIMGRPMVRNLMRAGYTVVVDSHNPAATTELVAEGAGQAATPREVAAATDVFISMVPDSPDVEEVYAGPDGAFESMRPGWLAIDMSSISPRVTRELAAKAAQAGAQFLDAPVSGGDKGAVAGTLSIMVGGDDAAFERAQPILRAMGTTIVHCGAAGAGQIVKLCNQVVITVVIEALSEALVLGAKAGVDPARIVEVLQGGMASTRMLEVRQGNLLGGHFEPGFRIRLHLKDLNNVLDFAREVGVPLPATALVEQEMQALRVAGRGELDTSSLITVLEELARFSVANGATGAPDVR